MAMLMTLRRLLERPIPPTVVGPSSSPPSLESLGREFPGYRRCFDFPGSSVDAFHKSIAEWPVEGGLVRGPVTGFLRPADALSLYELAYFAQGSVLEMGSAWGLSTTILCQALRNARRRARVISIEIDPNFQKATAQAVAARGLKRYYQAIHGDAGVEADRLMAKGHTFGFAFIDHDHAYRPTQIACRQLGLLLSPGGYALFHDFNDERNRSDPETYGVYRAVMELIQRPSWDFLGVIGCCALVRRRDS